jgi:hypothetical protein
MSALINAALHSGRTMFALSWPRNSPQLTLAHRYPVVASRIDEFMRLASLQFPNEARAPSLYAQGPLR